MDYAELARRLRGLHTVSTMAKALGVSGRTAVNYAYELKKRGFLQTTYGKRKIRIYRISPLRKEHDGVSLYEELNRHSKVKIAVREDYFIHKSRIPVEEVLVRAVETGNFRVNLAALGLFNKIQNWGLLLNLAKEKSLSRRIGALYDVARSAIRVRRMDKRTRKALMSGKKEEKFIVGSTKDFREIEEAWHVNIPFSRQDLEVYRE